MAGFEVTPYGRFCLTPEDMSGVIRPHWSRDGKWIHFRSDGPGRTGVYRCPAAGGEAIAPS
jgi:hypothetical protein